MSILTLSVCKHKHIAKYHLFLHLCILVRRYKNNPGVSRFFLHNKSKNEPARSWITILSLYRKAPILRYCSLGSKQRVLQCTEAAPAMQFLCVLPRNFHAGCMKTPCRISVLNNHLNFCELPEKKRKHRLCYSTRYLVHCNFLQAHFRSCCAKKACSRLNHVFMYLCS